jgi:hypothetical protein
VPATFYIASLPFQDTPQNGGSRSFSGITVGCGIRGAPAGFTAGGTPLGRTQRPGGVHATWLVLTGRRR